jgi:chitinase
MAVTNKGPAEHVFEGLLIGDFFTHWLHEGKIVNQKPEAISPSKKLDCSWVKDYILDIDPQNLWFLDRGFVPVAFIYLMLAELGSITHLDRLTIFLARPNGKKGSVSTPLSVEGYCENFQ